MATSVQASSRENPPFSFTGPFSDLDFQGEVPCDARASAWFIAAWDQEGPLPDCPRCGWAGGVDFSVDTCTMPYWCEHCGKPFSEKLRTLMSGSPLGLKKWAHFIQVWTGGDGPSSADELERRAGLAEGTGDGVNARLLCAATEDVVQLDEDCVLWRFPLGKSRRSRAHVVILKGCDTHRTVIGKLSESAGRDRESFRETIHRNLRGGHRLFLENPGLAEGLDGVTPRALAEIGDPSLSQLGLRRLQDRVETVIRDVYCGVSTANLDSYLAGIQWWENYGRLSHRERARVLAQGLRNKAVPRLKRSKKPAKTRQRNALPMPLGG